MGLDIKNKLYVVKNVPKNIKSSIVYKNVYTFFGKDVPAYIEDHYVGDNFDLSYLVFRGERAVLPSLSRKALLDSCKEKDTLEEVVTRVDTGEALIFFSTLCDFTYVSKISVYASGVENFFTPDWLEVSVVDRPLDIHYSIYRGDKV